MRRLLSYLLFLLVIFSASAQESDSINTNLPNIKLKNINGETVSLQMLGNNDNPLIICFWKTCCQTPNKLLTTINDVYEEWVEKTGVKIIIIAVDDSRSSFRVKPFVNAKRWDFEVLLDENSEVKRAMNISTVPYIILFNGEGNIVWKKSSFIEGDEEEIYEKIREISQNKN